MEKYKNYKDSGIEWIGEIPEHWEVKKLKFLFDIIPSNVDKKSKENEEKVLLCNYVDVYKNDKISFDLNFMEATASNSQIEKLTLQKNDVIATKDSEDLNDIGVPALVLSDMDGVVCGYHLTLFRSKYTSLYGKYLYWFLRSNMCSQYFSTLARGVTRYALGTSAFSSLPLFYLEDNEISTITNYLDHKTIQIDRLVDKKEQLIKLLQEERTAIINQAVTKGIPLSRSSSVVTEHSQIDAELRSSSGAELGSSSVVTEPSRSGVEMKDSGIEWLGKIPKHWEVKKLKYVVGTPLKYGANEPAVDEIFSNPRYIRITDFGKDGKLRRDTFKSLTLEKAENYLLEQGDVLFARSGATVGKTFLFNEYDGIACFAGYLIKAKCNPKIMNYKFLYAFTNSSGYEGWKDSISQSATIENIGADKYNQLKLPVPPIEEQKQIINFIESEEIRINTIITKTQQEITLLKEYKTALISEVVTGKVDIRNVVLN